MQVVLIQDLPAMFQKIGDIMRENEAYLCQLDAEMGDGDLGLTMRKGFGALPEIMEALLKEEQNLSKLLMKAGMKLASVVPSTMGTLMGSGIMGGGKALAGKEMIGGQELALFYRGFADGIAKRGKCQPGDRTVLDAVDCAAVSAAACADGSLTMVASAALQGAKTGLEATRTMLPKFGKAAVFSQKAVGCVDQGAVVGVLFAQAICDFCINN